VASRNGYQSHFFTKGKAMRTGLFTAVAIATLLIMPATQVTADQAAAKPLPASADHGKFKALQQDFQSGPEVTRACLSCHTEAA
jgi:hypothetical protein